LLKTAAGISGGFLKNNLKLASSSSLMGIATNTLKSGLSGTILKNTDKIIAWGTAIFNSFSSKNKVSDKNKRIENVIDNNVKYINAIDEKVNATNGLKSESLSLNVGATPTTPPTQTDAERGYKEGLFNNSDTEKV
jgi:hypothetical protein